MSDKRNLLTTEDIPKLMENKIIKLKINDIKIDYDIYPRQRLSHKTISAYQESLKAGAKFPSILIQKILDNGKEKIIIIDGLHRLEAFKENKENEIEIKYWKDEVLDKYRYLKELRIESIKRNLIHGDRLSNPDRENMCRKMAEDDSEITITYEEFGKIFNVTHPTIKNWIGDIRAKQKGSRDNLIYKLHMLGWGPSEISMVINLNISSISTKISKFKEFTKSKKSEFESGKTIKQIAEYEGLDLITTWAIILSGKSDIERFKLLGFIEDEGDKESWSTPKMYDIWNYPEPHSLMGNKNYPGMVQGQVVMNLLYYYTNPNDLVVDLMAGSGTVVDTCLLMGRRCYCFDNHPERNKKYGSERKDIIRHDWYKNGFPDKAKKADFIFLDPPYFKKKEDEYDIDSISALDREKYLQAFHKLAKMTKGYRVALIMGKYYDYNNPKNSIFLKHYINIFEEHNHVQVNEIGANYSPAVVKGGYKILRNRESKKIEILKRDLVIFESA